MNNVIIYCRISDKNDGSLLSQKELCLKYCKDNNISPNKIIMETSSARNGKNYNTLLSAIKDMSNGDLLLISSVCRFSRKVLDGLKLLEIMESKNINIYSINENLSYKSVYDKFNFRNYLNHAEYETDLISERLLRGKKINKHQPKYGYEKMVMRDGTTHLQKCIHEQQTLLTIKEMKTLKKSRIEICEYLNNKNILYRGKKWTPAKITLVLKNDN